MTARKPPTPPDDDIVFLETEGRDDVAHALAEAERAVEAVEEKHRRHTEAARSAPDLRPPVSLVADEPEEPRPAPAPPGPSAELRRELAETRERAIAAAEEAGKLREVLLRKTADFENLKRRTEKEKTDFFKFGLSEVFLDLLGVLDNFERALQHADSAAAGEFHVGIDMIARQLAELLKKYGLAEVPGEGLPFDPNIHEAVMREETSAAPPGTVLEVFQKGYTLNDRLLRAARVKVASVKTSAAGR